MSKNVLPITKLRKQLKLPFENTYEYETVRKLSGLSKEISDSAEELKRKLDEKTERDSLAKAMFSQSDILPLMEEIRSYIDQAECLCDRTVWPMPTYRELLFGVD